MAACHRQTMLLGHAVSVLPPVFREPLVPRELATMLGAIAVGVGLLLATLAALVARWLWARQKELVSQRILERHPRVYGFCRHTLLGATGNYLPAEASESSPGSTPRPRRRSLFRITDQLLERGSPHRCLLVLGGPGSGKTSFLLSYLVRHEKLGAARRQPIMLLSLGAPGVLDRIAAVPEPERRQQVLFLDGLDEDPAAGRDPEQRLRQLLELCQGFARVVLTARSELFSQRSDVAAALASPPESEGPAATRPGSTIRTVYLLPFSDRQVTRYLRRLYPFWKIHHRWAARSLLRRIPDWRGCPLVLAHLPDLLRIGRPVTKRSEIFQSIVHAWLLREQSWVDPEVLLELAKQLALRAYRNSVEGRGDRVAGSELEVVARDCGLQWPAWRLSSRSLVTEDTTGGYRFVHRSFTEYLFLPALLGMSAEQRRRWLGGVPLPWTEQMKQLGLEAFVRVGGDLSCSDLRGCDLNGVDLSDTRFAEAWLTRADLGQARLRDSDLRGANLDHANLSGADLSRADLTGASLVQANLRGANLTCALLEKSDLRGADLEGATIRGTTLVGSRLDATSMKSLVPAGGNWDGQVLTEPVTGIRFRWIPGGRFQMGGSGELNESPIHWVRISSFWLGETPVSNRQYARFLERTGHPRPEYWGDPRFSDPHQPVVGVSFDDALAFCRWLSEVSGLRVTLPTEAQWEYAARGIDGREYPWGSEPPDPSRACFGEDPISGRPAAVGSYPPGRGPFGTLDQAGEVWEWCLDAWDEMAYLKRAGKESLDPVVTGGVPGVQLVRGGSWFFPPEDLRAAFRGRNHASSRDDDLGFRVAIT